jgi:outer membrane beta-barrel protein
VKQIAWWLAVVALSSAVPVLAADNPVSPESKDQVIQPEIDRRRVTVPRIPTRDFEWSIYLGQYNAEAFGVKPVYGTRIGYHLSEDYFVEFSIAKSTIADTNFRTSGIPVFTEEFMDLYYYNMSFGVNLFPGELFLGRGRAWGTSLYLAGGIGLTSFDTFDRITLTIAGGLRILPTKRMSLRIELREHLYESDLLGENRYMRNLELTGGISIYF